MRWYPEYDVPGDGAAAGADCDQGGWDVEERADNRLGAEHEYLTGRRQEGAQLLRE